MKPSDITAAIAAGNHDLDSIADALGVDYTNYTLRTYLKMLVGTGAVTRTRIGDADWQVDRFDLNADGDQVSDECAAGRCGNCWDDACGCPMCGHSGA